MKARPRSVERRVAEYLSEQFAQVGMSPVERIPVLGRTGPDITMNEAKFVIDVKSRLEVPQLVLPPRGAVIFKFPDQLISFRLENLVDYFTKFMSTYVCGQRYASSKLVHDYYTHMDEWTKANCPTGTTVLILHKPRMPIGASAVVMHYSNFKSFHGGPNDQQ